MNNRKTLDLSIPEPFSEITDDKGLRERILSISYADWKRKGYSPGSLHYLKKCAESDAPLKLNKQAMQKLDSLD
jgi:CRISPR-associated protein Cas1